MINRRRFTRLSLALTAMPFMSTYLPSSVNYPAKRTIKASRLKRGDTIGLITPGSYLSDSGIEKAIQNIESLGLKVKLGKHIRAERGFTAGTDAQRLSDLHTMFTDSQVSAVWCARGGYGCSRLLPTIDYKLIRRNPKLLLGYSDITALLNAIYARTGLIGFHAPVGASDFTTYTVEHLSQLIFADTANYSIPVAAENLKEKNTSYHPKVIRSGIASGKLVGGNLSLIAAMVGSGYNINGKDRLVFLEDIGEKPYRIDRMLTQLRQADYFKGATGILLGVFADCEADEDDRSLTLHETLRDRLENLDIPILYGFSFGHIDNQCTIPIGVRATLNTETQRLTLLESVTN
ncbi:MAG: LD-carboxypeptidase [Saprospiraceae bacterium]